MTLPQVTGVRVHRFRDSVAITLRTDGENVPTLYIDAGLAQVLAQYLGGCAHDIIGHRFVDSQFPTQDSAES